MTENLLKLNPGETQVTVFGKSSDKAQFFPGNLLGSEYSPARKVKNYGVIFDCEFLSHIIFHS